MPPESPWMHLQRGYEVTQNEYLQIDRSHYRIQLGFFASPNLCRFRKHQAVSVSLWIGYILPYRSKLKGKKIALFSSHGWGNGEWIRNWEDTCRNDGTTLACDSVICQETPDDDAVTDCRAIGAALV